MPTSIIHRPAIRNWHPTIVAKTVIVLATSVTIGFGLVLLGAAGWGTLLMIGTFGAYCIVREKHWTARIDRNAETQRETYWATRDNTRDIGRLTDVAAKQRQLIERLLFAGPADVDSDPTGPQRVRGSGLN
jgi:hypothetical protein